MNIGEKLRQIRKERKLTLEQIAESTGLSQPFVSEIERSVKSPSIETLQKICTALGITLAEFFAEDTPDMPPEVARLLSELKDLTPEQVETLTEFIRKMKGE